MKVRIGINDFESNYPDLVKKYWDFSNNTVAPNEVLYRTNYTKCWFICEKGHSFQKTISAFIRGVDGREGPCPVCSGRQFLSGCNDLQTLRPELLTLWDFSKNSKDTKDVFYNNRKDLFWFKCSKGHSFRTNIVDLASSQGSRYKGCPVCAGKKVITGENDFAHVHPDLLKFWDFDKNLTSPYEVNYKDRVNYYWFICDNGHSFKSIPKNLVDRQIFRTKGCPVCSGRQVIPEVNDIVTLFPEKLKGWRYDLNDVDPSTLPSNSTYEMSAICSTPGCSKVYKTQVQYWVRDRVSNCEEHRLILNGRSIAANDIANMIRSWGIHVEEEMSIFKDSRSSVDMFLPEYNIAIEYNGLVWHTEDRRGKDLHYRKYRMCQDMGIRLIHIWEDDWLYNNNLMISVLKEKLNTSNSAKVNARSCIVSGIETGEARDFLNKNHIQGFISGEAYISLRSKGIIVAVIVIDGVGSSIHIKRYATSCNVRGGFSKLLHYIEETYTFSYLYTFSDNCISDGGLYKKTGFFISDYLSPDYSYLVKGRRVHKFNYRKERFKKDTTLEYREGLTERELADLNGLCRIWDAGKLKWVKHSHSYKEEE